MSGEACAVVRLRGLPSKTSKDDVLAFLEGFGLQQGSVFLNIHPRRNAGEAYVIFENLEDAKRACIKDKDMFGPKFGERFVRVAIVEDMAPSDLECLENAAAFKASRARRSSSQRMDLVVKVSGLPQGTSPTEVQQLFWGWQVSAAGTYVRPAPGQPCVEAFVSFEAPQAAAAAVAQRHCTTVTTVAGVFQLSVERATKAEYDAIVAAQQGSDGILRLRGLPIRATQADVLAFLQGYRIRPGGVHVQPWSENRHSKTALVEFEGAAEAARAMEKDRQRFGEAFGDRYCLLQLVRRDEFERELAKYRQQAASVATAASSGGSAATGVAVPQAVAAQPAVAVGMAGIAPLPLAGGVMCAGMLPSPAAAVAGFLQPAPLPGAGAGMMLPPGYALPPSMPPLPGGWPAMQPYLPQHAPAAMGMPPMLPATAAALGAAAVAAMPGWFSGGMPMQGGTAAARYMVQDLVSGHKVFLDPRFNLSSYNVAPPAPASCSALAATVTGTNSMGATAGPAASQQTQSSGQQGRLSGQECEGGAGGRDGGAPVAGLSAAVQASRRGSGLSEQTGAGAHAHALHGHHHRLHHAHRHHHQHRTHTGNDSSGDEGHTDGGSGGGSNDGSDTGSGAEDGGPRASAPPATSHTSSGDGSGAGAGDCDPLLPAEGRDHPGFAEAMEEDARQGSPAPRPGLAVEPPRRSRSPTPPAVLLADGVAVPPMKRTREEESQQWRHAQLDAQARTPASAPLVSSALGC